MSSIRKKIGVPIFIFKVMFVVGYYNEFTVVIRQFFVDDFLKMNPMVLSAPWANSLEIISLQPIKNIARD